MKMIQTTLIGLAVLCSGTGGCATAKGFGAAFGHMGDKTKYTPVVQFSIAASSANATTLDDWLRDQLQQSTFEPSMVATAKTACRDLETSSSLDAKLSCFNRLQDADTLRNRYVRDRLALSNIRCRARAEAIGDIMTGVNTGENLVTTFGTTTGIASSDAITSRVASGVVGVAHQLFSGARSDLLRDTNIMQFYQNMTELRAVRHAEIIGNLMVTNTDTPASITDYTLMQAVNDIDAYDRACDFIK